MPIYEYQCTNCEHEFDELQKMDDAPLTDCPECATAALVKLVSAPSFRLKGSGWYETDFKKDNRKNLADDSGGGKEAAADAAPKSDKSDKSDKAGKVDRKADTKKEKPVRSESKPANKSATSAKD